jgi:hypothetical protein
MGNRFAGQPEYHQLVRTHGILAAITFLFIVPAAIFTARFYWENPRLALRVHIWLQILTVLLSTVILVLGWFSVGPERSLTNPHHGIGIAIYVLIMFQAIWGFIVRKIERGRTIWRVSIKLMVGQRLLDESILTLLASSMAWKSARFARHCTSRTWTHTLWVAKESFHPIRPLDIRAHLGLVHINLALPRSRR